MITDIRAWIKHYEGYRDHPYVDSAGKVTIGYGRNLSDCGISREEAEMLFQNDFESCKKQLSEFEWYWEQPHLVRYALVNMCFNLGISKLLLFNKMIEALKEKNYTKAAIEALDSKWAKQVGQRAKDIASIIRECGDGT
jgi:lysozyme